MKLTILQTGEVPVPLRDRFGPYRTMFEAMFDATEQGFRYETVAVSDGEPLPDAGTLEGIVITGSPAGVYDDFEWLDPLRAFIRDAYAKRVPMVGVCFGHQIMADALGGEVRKSEKGWGLGRHHYAVQSRPAFMRDAPATLAIACSHQDQVITPPTEAEVILASAFSPNAGLAYRNGAAISFQPHPEFTDDYAAALAELRRGKVPDEVVDTALASIAIRSDSADLAGYIGQFFKGR
ncbi:MAG TPA: type 1 glutamine amidotransferase [Devosia sp.]|jgi:GMP synthase-like glutamine amidotransferase|nr:type 1 glutamine amidotransferase [Devosia sp.]